MGVFYPRMFMSVLIYGIINFFYNLGESDLYHRNLSKLEFKHFHFYFLKSTTIKIKT